MIHAPTPVRVYQVKDYESGKRWLTGRLMRSYDGTGPVYLQGVDRGEAIVVPAARIDYVEEVVAS